MDISSVYHVGIAGAGAWGTALAVAASSAGRKVTLWANDRLLAEAINRTHENARFLPGHRVPDGVIAAADPAELTDCDLILVVCPAQSLRNTLALLQHSAAPFLICAKGIERGTGLLMPEVAGTFGATSPVGMLSGPSFAVDVVAGLPCAVTIAFDDEALALRASTALGSPSFRPYASTDVVGVAIGGAVKNVLAIACGIVEGRGLGESARAALTTRGFAEMARFGVALGARLETMSGLSGFGDLVLTASSRQSRNFSLGVALARGEHPRGLSPLAEGATTAPALVQRAQALGIQMPIAEAVAAIVGGHVDVDTAIRALLSRPLKSEH